MSFKRGDKVRYIHPLNSPAIGLILGEVYTVRWQDPDGITLDEATEGAWFMNERFELVKDEPQKVWCGLCGKYVVDGQRFPCAVGDTVPETCGVLGKPIHSVEDAFAPPPVEDASPNLARDSQVGGSHYTKLSIQPFEYSLANGLDACQHTAIKYITRFREKGGIPDLEKAIHTIQFLIEHEKKHSK